MLGRCIKLSLKHTNLYFPCRSKFKFTFSPKPQVCKLTVIYCFW